MKTMRLTSFVVFSAALAAPLSAQRAGESATARVTYDPRLYTSPASTSPRFKALRWREIGPFRGGRVDAVTGDPTRPLVFYFGAVNGGVWKTTNAGQTWRNLTDGKSDISSVGAITIAPSDPNVIYVGTGESQLREDLTYGTGMYRSTDAGQTWQHLGLNDTHQITDVIVDPRDPDRVYVSAIGHAFGPNAERGVFRTTDGGKSWKKILFIDDSTGANDLTIDPSNPRILYASFWKFQRTPWSMIAGGGRSGIWKTLDGGDTWTELTFNPGIPKLPLGKIGLDVSAANPRRIYASIEAPDSAGGIFRSDNGGDTWQRTTPDPRFHVRAWYYSLVTADPSDENTVYVMNLQVWKSIDGGKTFSMLRVPHGDTHIMWVDPRDSKRLINGNDGGANVSLDGGATWSRSDNNQPTAQFYHVMTDNQWPYRVYGGQQDNSAVSIASRSDDGEIGDSDYYSVAGCENATIAVDPRDPNITYGGCYTGFMTRHDRRARQERDISAWMGNYDGYAAADIKYRFQWTYPVVISPHDPKTLYATSQFVMRSRDEGASWEKISPDLTVADPKTLERTGGPIHGEMTGAEWYATVYAFNESPRSAGLLWAGSDDGLIHVSRNAGANWENVTPRAYGKFTRTAGIEPSHFDPAIVYVAANRYQQDDFAPYLWKSSDYGKTWTSITTGIPHGAYARTIREDPVRRGLLYAGTEIGVYVSFDDGAHWEPLQINLPRVSVRDLRVHGNDLVAATHGRSFWAIDDLSLVRQLADSVTAKAQFLFQPSPAVRWFSGGGTSLTAGQNPRGGAYIDYWLRTESTAKVTLDFLDGTGKLIRSYSSEPPKPDTLKTALDSLAFRTRAAMKDSIAYDFADSVVSVRAGTNRFVWNLRYPGAKELKNTLNDEGTLEGPIAPPGNYGVRLVLGKDTLTRQFAVIADPRATSTAADLIQQFELVLKTRDKITEVVEHSVRIEDVQSQLDQRVTQTKDLAFAKRVDSAAAPLRKKFEALRAELYEVGCHVDQCSLDQPMKLYNQLMTINGQIQLGDYAPTAQHREMFAEWSGKVAEQLRKLQQLEENELAAFNRLMQELGMPAVFVPARKVIS